MLRHTKREVINQSFKTCVFFVMFVTAVCVLFLLKLKWPKNKSLNADVFPAVACLALFTPGQLSRFQCYMLRRHLRLPFDMPLKQDNLIGACRVSRVRNILNNIYFVFSVA